MDPSPHLSQSPQGLADLQGPPVWVPSIVFVNTPNTDLTVTDTKASLNVRKLGQYSVSTLDNVEQVRQVISLDDIINVEPQVMFYEGSDNPINYKRKYSQDFSCDIQLKNYPFDSQLCKMRLDLPSKLQGLVRLEPGQLTFSGSVEMLQFRVENWNMTRTQTGLQVHLHHSNKVTQFYVLVFRSKLLYRGSTTTTSTTHMLVLSILYNLQSRNISLSRYPQCA